MSRLARLLLSVGLGLFVPAIAQAAAPRDCTATDFDGVPQAHEFLYRSAGFALRDINSAFAEMTAEPPARDAVLEGVIAADAFDVPFDTTDAFGFGLKFVVGLNGRVTCIALAPALGEKTLPSWNQGRWMVAQSMPDWRFRPFRVAGKASRVVAKLTISEYEAPRVHIAIPAGDRQQVVLIVDEHLGNHIEMHGDGRAVYDSRSPYYFLGPQAYEIDPESVAYVLKAAEEADFWSLRDVYPIGATATEEVEWHAEITLGGVTKSLTVYRGAHNNGLAPEATFLGYGTRHVVDVGYWHSNTPEMVARLKRNGFDFKSTQAGRYLLQITADAQVSDDVIQTVMAEGAPLDLVEVTEFDGEARSLLDAALCGGRLAMARGLIDAGGLRTEGVLDQAKIDRAFLQAVSSGKVAAVDLIAPLYPAMTYPDRYSPDVPVSVLFRLMDRYFGGDRTAMALRLLGMGADINARQAGGTTLLHRAANNEDTAFILFLLDHGADINALDKDGEAPVAASLSEVPALLLLEHGADPRAGKTSQALRNRIRYERWPRVVLWLKAHGYGDVLVAPAGEDA